MSCNCSSCQALKGLAYTVGTTFQIIVTDSATLENGDCVKICCLADLPSMKTIVPVTLKRNGGAEIPLRCRCTGNNLMSDQLYQFILCRTKNGCAPCFCAIYGTNSANFTLTCQMQQSAFYPVSDKTAIVAAADTQTPKLKT